MSGAAMSAPSLARRLPVPASAPRSARAALRLVPTRRTSAPRAPFLAVVVVLLAGGLLGLLALNTALAQDAFRLHALTKQGKELADREQALAREVETLRTPRNLAARARELGMVEAEAPAFLRLPDGAVLGAELPAPAPPPAPAPAAPGPGE
jgi:cell division protein FtsB